MAQKNLKILTQVLALEGMKVAFDHAEEGIGILLKISAIAKTATCPHCHQKSHRLHQNHRQIVKDIPWGDEVLSEIEEVSIDLWKGDKSLVEELIPNAQVVADRFPVMTQVNGELDRQRKAQKRETEAAYKGAKNESERNEIEAKLKGLKKRSSRSRCTV